MSAAVKDALDAFLDTHDDPKAWRTITPDGVPLSKEELDVLLALSKGTSADVYFDPFAPSIDFFTGTVQEYPVALDKYPPKRRFIPSAHEMKIVKRLVRAIKMGWIKKAPEIKKEQLYDLWVDDTSPALSSTTHIAAPKIPLPGHRESYRPPPEYLPTPAAKERFERAIALGENPSRKWLPRSYTSLRHVSEYPFAFQERYSRCLDLYMCPREKKIRLNIDPESLLPKLPDLSELRPYPNAHALTFSPVSIASVTAMDIDLTGHWILTGYSDGTLSLTDAIIGYCYAKWKLSSNNQPVNAISWNPSPSVSSLAAVAVGSSLFIVHPFITPSSQQSTIDQLFLHLTAPWKSINIDSIQPKKIPLRACVFSSSSSACDITRVAWHRKGDYLATVAPKANNSAILIHKLSKSITQSPFARVDGTAIDVAFHPSKPFFYLVTQKAIRILDLSRQLMHKKISLNRIRMPSSIALHPNGEHLLVGALDYRVSWFDIELSSNGAYRTLGYHKDGVRSVGYHHKYPLFASCSDDGHAHICYGKVFDDTSLQNPLIIPVKILKPSSSKDGLKPALNALVFHPIYPWIYLGAANGSVSLFVSTLY